MDARSALPLRQYIRQQRRHLTPEEQSSASQALLQRLLIHPAIQQANCLALFLPFDGEINLHPLALALQKQGKMLALPVLHPFSRGHLLFLYFDPTEKLTLNRFGIAEPRLDIRKVIPFPHLDVILVPLVAFDRQGHRLGMGGGFYDRTLVHWQDHAVYPIGVAHDCQQVASVPVAHWDVPLPEIMTPSTHWHWPEHG